MDTIENSAGESIVDDGVHWLDEHGDYLFSYALARIGDSHQAEDLVQESFLAAVRGKSGFRGESTVRTWLTSILRRKVIDYFRGQRRAEKKIKLSACDLAVDTAEARSDDRIPVDGLQFSNVFDQCLKKLSPAAAEAFVLRIMDGLGTNEVCRTLGISARNLSVRLHRARFALKECLEKNGFHG
ncbi:RNA polymerase sigma factor YlaC [Thalassoglobus neptunius]|uniref:RNA polymerase sigma factor YlaC n=1 Tax=Thalassoglobus neptunius TaxID=1938619 RepID=A0A5C5VAL8_9PLAN|nr:sigma-70 family RNA polymerase sigma factor [Thalassoglobus neptunius]TWT35023.1 RNA polymerase sigma factor YlaC [Thalassoglobus neptunius]